MLGIEPSTFVSKIDILTTIPIVHYFYKGVMNYSKNEYVNPMEFVFVLFRDHLCILGRMSIKIDLKILLGIILQDGPNFGKTLL